MLNAPALLAALSFLLTTLSDSIFGGVLDARFIAPLCLSLSTPRDAFLLPVPGPRPTMTTRRRRHARETATGIVCVALPVSDEGFTLGLAGGGGGGAVSRT